MYMLGRIVSVAQNRRLCSLIVRSKKRSSTNDKDELSGSTWYSMTFAPRFQTSLNYTSSENIYLYPEFLVVTVTTLTPSHSSSESFESMADTVHFSFISWDYMQALYGQIIRTNDVLK